MKKAVYPVLILLIFLCSCTTRDVSIKKTNNSLKSAEIIGPKKRVVIADFKVEPVYGRRRLGNSAADILISSLQHTGRFIIVERERLAVVIDEQKLALTGLADASTAASIGNILGADAIVTGSVTKFGVNITSSDVLIGDSKTQTASAEVNIRLIDVSSGKITMAETGIGQATKTYSSFLGMGSTGGYDEALEGDALKAAVIDVVDKIVQAMNKVPWKCRIVKKTDGDTIIIDAGKESNLQIGTILKVIKRNEEIKSPTTGEILGYSESLSGSLKVDSYLGDNGAYCKILSDTGISGEDICRLKE